MKYTFKILFMLVVFGTIITTSAYAKNDIIPNTVNKENVYRPLGYSSLEEAVSKFKKDNDLKVIKLPTKYPFKVTDKFGKIDKDGKLNLYLVNKNTKQMFKIYIFNNNHFTLNQCLLKRL